MADLSHKLSDALQAPPAAHAAANEVQSPLEQWSHETVMKWFKSLPEDDKKAFGVFFTNHFPPEARGKDLARMTKEDFIAILGHILGPSLYEELQPLKKSKAASGPALAQPSDLSAKIDALQNALTKIDAQMQQMAADKTSLTSLTKEVRRLRLHESISHSYAAVGGKAEDAAQLNILNTLNCLSPVDDTTLNNLWKDCKSLAVPEPKASETDYQAILEDLMDRLLDHKQFRLCRNVYIPPLRPDISVIPMEELYPRWSNLLWCMELETDLKGKYHHGLGQAWSYAGEACLRQESRDSIFVVVTSLREIQILRRSWDDAGKETATCTPIMPLMSSSDTPPLGFAALVRLARAKSNELGYTVSYLQGLTINNAAYDLLCVISNGGKAKIYKAHREGIHFAIKILEASARSRIEQEAEVLKTLSTRIRDAQIPQLIDVECNIHRACLVTSPAGIPLTAEMLKNGSVPLNACFGYGRQLIRILRVVHHTAGFLHCDIHPGNFIVDEEKKNVFLVDWELARPADAKQREVQFCGVAAYLSDDYLRNVVAGKPHEITWRDDLISLGYSLLYLSNGHLPWISAGADCAEILAKRRNFAFPEWFNNYRERVTRMDPSDTSYEDLGTNLLESGPKDKCTVILNHSRTPARNGTECGKGLPCPHHNPKAKKWQKETEELPVLP